MRLCNNENNNINKNNNNNNSIPNLGQKTRPYNNQQKKKKKKKKRTCKIVDFAVLGDHRIKLKECEKKDKYLDLVRELKKLWNMKVTIIPIMIGSRQQRIIKGTGRLGNKRTSGDYPNYYIENNQNTEESPGDLLSHKPQ